MECKTIKNKLSQYIDNMCSEEDKLLIDEHLKICSECMEENKLLKSIIEDLNDIEEVDLPEGYHESLISKLKSKKIETKKSILNKYKKYYPSIAAAFVIIVVFSILGTNPIKKYGSQSDGELFDNYSKNEISENNYEDNIHSELFMSETDEFEVETNQIMEHPIEIEENRENEKKVINEEVDIKTKSSEVQLRVQNNDELVETREDNYIQDYKASDTSNEKAKNTNLTADSNAIDENKAIIQDKEEKEEQKSEIPIYIIIPIVVILLAGGLYIILIKKYPKF